MTRFHVNKISTVAALALALGMTQSGTSAQALTVDWSGYFRADHNFVHNYQMDKSSPGYSNSGAGGEYIAGQGSKSTTFSSVYMKLKPKVLVNDNVIVRSEWNVGDPVYGLFGRNVPREDRTNPFSTGKDGMSLSVSRLWLDTHTDFGTIQVGRAPMHWGLGVIFNSGDQPFDRYQSTSDTIRLVSKFGYLSLMPIYAKNAMGRNLAGSSDPLLNTTIRGSDDVTDYGLSLSYNNPEEDLEGGALFYKRNASDSQNSYFYPAGSATYVAGGANGMNVKLFDFYVRKSWTKWEVGAELPIYSGDIGDMNGAGSRNTYKATALAAEAAYKGESWKHQVRFGSVPGQSPATTGARGKSFGAMQFHRAYKLGQILFGYNLGQFGQVNPDPVSAGTAPLASVSPYDSAITNAKYLMLSSEKKWEQWGMNFGLVYAQANEVASAGKDAYNHRTKSWFTSVASQNDKMGLELDFGLSYNWDDNISFGADLGMLFPGKYFEYINSATKTSPADTVTALSLSAVTVF